MTFTPERGEHAQCWHEQNAQGASTGDSGTPSSSAATDIASGPLIVMLPNSPTDTSP
jgi:hypothetical protein